MFRAAAHKAAFDYIVNANILLGTNLGVAGRRPPQEGGHFCGFGGKPARQRAVVISCRSGPLFTILRRRTRTI